jgi:signal transduction histidine kinase/DNA-binding response OmpR family regulator
MTSTQKPDSDPPEPGGPDVSGAQSADYSAAVANEQVRLLFEHLPSGLAINLLNASILVYAVSGTVEQTTTFSWLAAVVLIVVLRTILMIAYQRAKPQADNLKKWQFAFDCGALAIGAAWGVTGLWATSAGDFVTPMFVGFVLGGMAAGALSTLAINFRTYLLYLLPSLLPFMASLFFVGTNLHVSMGVMVTLFLAGLFVSGKRYNRALVESLSLRYENLGLIKDLKSAIQTAEDANEAKTLFLANMSHEIRTPMNGVIGMTNLLKSSALSNRQRRLIDTVHHSAKSLLTIINDILDLTRIEAGKIELDHSEFLLRECFEDSADLLAGEADRKGLDLTVFIANDVPHYVEGDSGRLRQICVNLIGNAVKFSNEGGISLNVTAEANDHDDRTMIEISVSDTGIGIGSDVLSRMQDPFAQEDASISRRFGGTGLGLSITRHLVELMGGTLDITSEKGAGTHVTVAIPFVVGDANQDCDRATDSELDGVRLLVAGIQDIHQEIVRSYLSESGAIVTCVASPPEALTLLRDPGRDDTPFAAVIIDQALPNNGGSELCRIIETDEDISCAGALMLTSLGWKEEAGRDGKIEFAEMLTKPVRRRELNQSIMRVLHRSRSSSHRSDELIERPDSQRYSGRVLIVEDNPVNEEVARAHIESFGCATHSVCNGREAIATFENQSFDLIFMDLQMPELDGLAATQKIREIEQSRGAGATPIVALTATAFRHERQACLDVGMNGYISKPFAEHELESMLRKFLQSAHHTADELVAEDLTGLPSIDRSKPEFAVRLIDTYLQHSLTMLCQLKVGLEEKNADDLRRTAHSLKSSSANIGAENLAALCQKIEDLCGRKHLTEAAPIVLRFVAEYEKISRHLRKVSAELNSGPSSQSPNRADKNQKRLAPPA